RGGPFWDRHLPWGWGAVTTLTTSRPAGGPGSIRDPRKFTRGTPPGGERFYLFRQGGGGAVGSPVTRVFPLAIAACTLAAAAFTFVPSQAQNSRTAKAGTSSDPASLPDQELGRRFTVKPEDLPPPRTGPVVSNRPLTLAFHEQTPRVPEGFKAT